MTSTSLPYSPAAERNREPILASLQALLPESASVLEIAAGTGQHAEHFAGANPRWRWLPTDAKQDLFAGIAARTAALPNVAAPQVLDVTRWQPAPGFGPFDAVYCANMLHA
jgi:tRNA G46 methylase TrmB